jgi:4-diphosphocytidyl-2-C-methyl-D-erythritol kinase
MKIRSHCKINLFLHILGKKDDGYHELESLFYFPEIYDEIEISEDVTGDRLKVIGRFGAELQDNLNQNIILKTYSLLKILYSTKLPDLSFTLTKNVPVASGIGGGSANAAAVLKYLNETYELGLRASQLYKIGARLGADVPACILDKTCFAKGIGDVLEEVFDFPKLNILLVNPLVAVSTAEIFRAGFSVYTSPLNKDMGFKTTQTLIDFLEGTRNDLEPSAKKLCPQINNITNDISSQSGCLLSRMSGSGATCFGIFETKDKAIIAKENILKQNPNFWIEVG